MDKTRKNIASAMLALAAVITMPILAYAHGGGASVEKTVGPYILDIGYDPETFLEGESTRFDFAVYSATSVERQPIAFTDVWVRVTAIKEKVRFNPVVFAGNIYAEGFGPPGMTYVFPESGAYELTVRFQNNGEEVAETSIPVTVTADTSKGSGAGSLNGGIFAFGVVAGMIVGGSVALLFLRKKSSIQSERPGSN